MGDNSTNSTSLGGRRATEITTKTGGAVSHYTSRPTESVGCITSGARPIFSGSGARPALEHKAPQVNLDQVMRANSIECLGSKRYQPIYLRAYAEAVLNHPDPADRHMEMLGRTLQSAIESIHSGKMHGNADDRLALLVAQEDLQKRLENEEYTLLNEFEKLEQESTEFTTFDQYQTLFALGQYIASEMDGSRNEAQEFIKIRLLARYEQLEEAIKGGKITVANTKKIDLYTAKIDLLMDAGLFDTAQNFVDKILQDNPSAKSAIHKRMQAYRADIKREQQREALTANT